ncbi:A/G-specific adenine glycosylase [Kineothrix sp. MSJ-39]|uniref:A/G-specific adenine glycosylase n=1 Tax=Kineothrix sp. MSJ-39 TaxID=2841533 RepID=UPI001C128FE4|nr:A/G-specific adenine glycosylase [Kineothrix sp. MSJ-39]MBU5430141.1 A/G-specific adenine glycosylase [Kineothrix sp. MSJ-39]
MKEYQIGNEIIPPLLAWYDGAKRILPWRGTKDPYRIWVSEIMLQQTRVEAVKPYYDRFMQALPTVCDLAGAEESYLLKLWEGLGYYNRVRNMQKAAQILVEKFDGEMPADAKEILALPGIGSYTMGAIASIAFQIPLPAVDGNVLRILTRLYGDDSDILDPRFKKKMEESLACIMPKDRPGDVNQAMMELGATVCLPNGMPKCESCPWYERCIARKEDRLREIPYKAPKKSRKKEKKTVFLICDGDRILIHKRGKTGLLAGLYEFPNVEGWLADEQVKQQVQKLGYEPLYLERLQDSVHIFTHKEWHMQGWLIRVAAAWPQEVQQADYHLILPQEIEAAYPIPSAFRAYTNGLHIALGNAHFLR